MNYRSGLLTGIGFTLLLVGALLATWWIATAKRETQKKTAAPPPATIDHVLKEDQINHITLTDDAIGRLALATEPITIEPVARSRTYGGEVVLPPGQAVIVSAPVSGLLKAADHPLQPGHAVQAGESLLQLQPILTPEGRANLASALVQAEGDVNTATTQREGMQIALARAKRVFQNEAGSRRALDDAQAQFDLAEQTLAAARKRQDTLKQLVGDTEAGTGTAGPITIDSPRSGLLRSVSAATGQIVPAGAALFEVIDVHGMWVKVSIHASEADLVDVAGEAKVGPVSARPGQYTSAARPIDAPPSANPLSGTIDVYYAIGDDDAAFRPGQRLGVQLPLAARTSAPVIAWSGVVHDIYGGTWVYEQTDEHTFVRRRVAVEHVTDGKAVLAAGPPAGAKIVVAGAAELFGTETGFTK
jgi:cobalt-zinc-cadmium efflux system membrane fusion protein